MPDFRHPDFFNFIDGLAVKTAVRVLESEAEAPAPERAPPIPAALASFAAIRAAESS